MWRELELFCRSQQRCDLLLSVLSNFFLFVWSMVLLTTENRHMYTVRCRWQGFEQLTQSSYTAVSVPGVECITCSSWVWCSTYCSTMSPSCGRVTLTSANIFASLVTEHFGPETDRHCSDGSKVSGHFGTSTEVSKRHFGHAHTHTRLTALCITLRT